MYAATALCLHSKPRFHNFGRSEAMRPPARMTALAGWCWCTDLLIPRANATRNQGRVDRGCFFEW
jgi:hypothetical protein